MLTVNIFRIDLALGYIAAAFVVVGYALPWLRAMHRAQAQRIIATFHSFRFLGLVFVLPGVVGPGLPAGFAVPAAYGDLATSLLAIGALATVRVRALFWLFVVAFNLVGTVDLVSDTARAVQLDLPARAGALGAAYFIPIVYVPFLILTHLVAFYLLLRRKKPNAESFAAAAMSVRASGPIAGMTGR